MNTWRAFAFTPAAIISEAKVCLHSCGVIRSSPASRQALSARAWSFCASKGDSAVEPKHRSEPARPLRARCSAEVVAEHGGDRHLAPTGTRLQPDLTLDRVIPALDANDARREVQCLDPKGAKLPAT